MFSGRSGVLRYHGVGMLDGAFWLALSCAVGVVEHVGCGDGGKVSRFGVDGVR